MVFSIFIEILKETSVTNSGESDQLQRFAGSNLVLHCLPMSHKKDARLIWVKLIDSTRIHVYLCKYVNSEGLM